MSNKAPKYRFGQKLRKPVQHGKRRELPPFIYIIEPLSFPISSWMAKLLRRADHST